MHKNIGANQRSNGVLTVKKLEVHVHNLNWLKGQLMWMADIVRGYICSKEDINDNGEFQSAQKLMQKYLDLAGMEVLGGPGATELLENIMNKCASIEINIDKSTDIIVNALMGGDKEAEIGRPSDPNRIGDETPKNEQDQLLEDARSLARNGPKLQRIMDDLKRGGVRSKPMSVIVEASTEYKEGLSKLGVPGLISEVATKAKDFKTEAKKLRELGGGYRCGATPDASDKSELIVDRHKRIKARKEHGRQVLKSNINRAAILEQRAKKSMHAATQLKLIYSGAETLQKQMPAPQDKKQTSGNQGAKEACVKSAALSECTRFFAEARLCSIGMNSLISRYDENGHKLYLGFVIKCLKDSGIDLSETEIKKLAEMLSKPKPKDSSEVVGMKKDIICKQVLEYMKQCKSEIEEGNNGWFGSKGKKMQAASQVIKYLVADEKDKAGEWTKVQGYKAQINDGRLRDACIYGYGYDNKITLKSINETNTANDGRADHLPLLTNEPHQMS